jgi:hypothetical protein
MNRLSRRNRDRNIIRGVAKYISIKIGGVERFRVNILHCRWCGDTDELCSACFDNAAKARAGIIASDARKAA